ncbi:MAG: hypothetical protein K8T25_10800 [Planctomycetia bacterium]|nr:hypothetical protein [Planctomycetia bacterium]
MHHERRNHRGSFRYVVVLAAAILSAGTGCHMFSTDTSGKSDGVFHARAARDEKIQRDAAKAPFKPSASVVDPAAKPPSAADASAN